MAAARTCWRVRRCWGTGSGRRSLAGVAPFAADGLEWQRGMGQANVEEFAAAVDGEPALRGYLAAEREGILASTRRRSPLRWRA